MLIGITGRAGTGKDTAATHLRCQHQFYQFAFADPLRAMLAAAFGLEAADFEPGKKEQLIPWIGKSPRQLLQTLGTEWGRNLVTPDIWVRVMEQRLIGAGATFGRNVVISDVRMENEAALIRRMGGTVLHLRRDAARPVSTHISEDGIAMHASDQTFINNGGLPDLFEFLDNLLDADYLRKLSHG